MAAGSTAETGGFSIEVKKGDAVVTEYEAGQKYMVTLKRTGDTKLIKGFTLQANEAAGADATGGLGKKYVGEFGGTLPATTQIGCGATPADVKGAVSHNAPPAAGWTDGVIGPFEWTAPADGEKDVYFNAIGVESQAKWYGEKNPIMTKLTKKAATQTVDCTTFTEQSTCTDTTCEWKENACKTKAAAVDCTKVTEQSKCTDATCEWKENACKAKAAAVDCTKVTEESKCTDATCEWKENACKTKATTTVDCTADAMKTKEECEKKPDDCVWANDACSAKAAAKCSDKTAEADCTAMTGCTWASNACATTTSIECPKKSTEDDCKGMQGCKWNADTTKCEEAVDVTKDNGAFKLGVAFATLLLAAAAHFF